MFRGHTKVIIANVLFSLSPLLFKTITLDAVSILWSVNCIAVITLVIKTITEKQIGNILKVQKHELGLLLLAVLFTMNNLLFISSIKTTTIANAVLTHYLAPILVVVFARFLIKERITRTSLLALFLSLVGFLAIVSPARFTFTDIHFKGLVLGTLSAVFFSMEILTKKALTKHCEPQTLVIHYLSISVVLLIPFVSFDRILAIEALELAILFAAGALVSGLGITLFTSGLRDIPAQHAGILSYLEPLAAVAWALLILTEIPREETVIGGSLILLAMYLIARAQHSPKNSQQTEPVPG